MHYESTRYFPYVALAGMLQHIRTGRRHVLLLLQEEGKREGNRRIRTKQFAEHLQ